MPVIARSILAILLGLFAAACLIGGIELIEHLIYPLPAGVDPQDNEAMKRVVRTMPAGAFGILLAGWTAGTFAGAWVASRVAFVGKLAHGLAIGAIFLAATVAMLCTLPHPIWVWIAAMIMLPIAAYAGAKPAAGSGSTPSPTA